MASKHFFTGSQRIATKMVKKEQNGNSGNVILEKEQYYYHPDHLGSSSFVTDEKGKVYEHLEYFPFGETFAHEHSNTQVTPYRFTGKELDEVTGLYYYGARYYDPRTSVWVSADPIIEKYMDGQGNSGVFNPQNINLYTYTYNNPINLSDPDGNIPVDTVWDLGSIVWDVGKIAVGYATGNQKLIAEGGVDLAADAVALAIPYVPAGASKVARMADDTVKAASKPKTYQTYNKTNKETGEVYTGRTSGTDTPFNNVKKRDKNHHMNDQGFGPAVLDKSSTNKAAIRGREQRKIDEFGGAKSQDGSSGNAINGISNTNKNKEHYMNENIKEFGE